MSRSATTGIYTRLSNSFSEPVTGTTIDPTDADSYFDDIDAAMNSFVATSTTSLAIGTGTKAFTTQTNKSFLVGAFVQAFSQADHANYMYGTVVSYNTGTGVLTLDVVSTGGSGTLADWLLFTAGARGGTGATGAQGSQSGFKYTFNTATSGDPGTGKFLFNNATFASATEMNISETDGDSNSLATLLATLDDSTSTNKCLVLFQKENDTEAFLAYITGTLTDNGTYDTFSITPISALGSPANNDVFRLTPIRTGDKGADGAGTGDVSAASNFGTDNVVVRSDGTTKGVQSSGVSISDANNVSGVASLSATSIELGHASDTTITRTSAGVIAVEGVDVALNSTSAVHTAGTIELGAASDTTLSRSAAGVLAVEGVPVYSQIPQNSQSAAYTLVLADAQKHILHPTADNNARTFTIPANSSVAYPIGTAITFVNQINTVTISITTDTLTLAGAGSTGSRTLAANGIATALKVSSTGWVISGTGLT